jgi:uncharacterized membrane protein
MEIPLKAEIECSDGPCGKSTALVFNPVTKDLTHVVVEVKGTKPPEQRLVPLARVVESTHKVIRLGCTIEDVEQMPLFVATYYESHVLPDQRVYQGEGYYAPYSTVDGADYVAIEEEQIPEGERAIHPGTRVEATDGHLGTVSGLVVDDSGKTVTHFVLEQSHRLRKTEVTLPLSAIDRKEGDTVYLKLDRGAVKQLPAIPLRKHYVVGDTNIELVARVFRAEDKDNEQQALDALEFAEDLHRRRTIRVLNAAVLAKDTDGHVSVVDSREIDPKKGRVLGAITGGLVGLLAGPGGAVVGALTGLGAGGAAGKWIDEGFSDKFLDTLREYLQPGTAATILLMENEWVRPASEAMAGLGGYVFQQSLTDRLVEDMMAADETKE